MSSSSLWRVRDGRIEDEDDIVTFQCQLAMETEHRALTEDVVRQGVRNVLNGKIDSAKYFVAEDIHCTSPGKAIGSLMITKEWSDWRNGYFMWIQVSMAF